MVHKNSVEAFQEIKPDIEKRRRAILDVYEKEGRPLTDREVCCKLCFTDMNMVRPRITELIYKGLLRECAERVKDFLTEKMVRTVEFNTKQLDLF